MHAIGDNPLIELTKTRAFLLRQEGHKRLQGRLHGRHVTPDSETVEALTMINAGIRVMAHVHSGATPAQLRLTGAYEEMLWMEAAHDIFG